MLLQNIVVYASLVAGFSVVFCGIGLLSLEYVRSHFVESGFEQIDSVVLVESFAVGLALVGFISFAAAAANVFYWPFVAGVLLIACTIMASRLAKTYPVEKRRQFAKSIRLGFSVIPWLIAVVIAIPSVLPDTTSDAQSFHLLYPKEWVDAHGLTVDPYIHQPLYAMNWLTLDGFLELIGLGWYAPVLVGLCYAWSVQGIFALTGICLPARVGKVPAFFIALTTTGSFALSPIALHWAFTGLVDCPIGFFFLASLIAAILAFRSRMMTWLGCYVVLSSFFVGMKTSLVLFVPLFLALTAMLALRMGRSRRSAYLYVLSFVFLAMPWYLRNFVLDGDPVAPTLNILRTGKDLYWNRRDLAGQLSDLPSSAKTLSGALMLPIDIFFHSQENAFREYGAPIGYLLLFVPIFALIAMLVYRARRLPETTLGYTILFGAVSYAIAYYGFTSTLMRYQFVFAAAFSACLGIVCSQVTRLKISPWFVVVAMIVVSVPGASSYSWMNANEQYVLQGLSLPRNVFLDQRLEGHDAAQFVIANSGKFDDATNVYGLGAGNLCLTLRRGGLGCMGDWSGPARFTDLNIAIHVGSVAEYVRKFHLGAFILRRGGQPITDLGVSMLGKQLETVGFAQHLEIDKNYAIFLKNVQGS